MPTLPWAAAETAAVADYALTRRSVTEMQQADSAAIQSFFALRHAESAQASLQKVRAGSRGAGARPTMTRMRNERMRSDFLTCVIHDGMKSREAVAFLAKREGLAVEIVRRNLHPQELMKNLRASGVVAQISRRRRKPLP